MGGSPSAPPPSPFHTPLLPHPTPWDVPGVSQPPAFPTTSAHFAARAFHDARTHAHTTHARTHAHMHMQTRAQPKPACPRPAPPLLLSVARWEGQGYFQPRGPEQGAVGEPYVITMPPPNVTGRLHMGHAMFATVQVSPRSAMRAAPVRWYLPARGGGRRFGTADNRCVPLTAARIVLLPSVVGGVGSAQLPPPPSHHTRNPRPGAPTPRPATLHPALSQDSWILTRPAPSAARFPRPPARTS